MRCNKSYTIYRLNRNLQSSGRFETKPDVKGWSWKNCSLNKVWVMRGWKWNAIKHSCCVACFTSNSCGQQWLDTMGRIELFCEWNKRDLKKETYFSRLIWVNLTFCVNNRPGWLEFKQTFKLIFLIFLPDISSQALKVINTNSKLHRSYLGPLNCLCFCDDA